MHDQNYFYCTSYQHTSDYFSSKRKRYRGDITRWREDLNFIFEKQNNILRTSAASELNIVQLARESQNHASSVECVSKITIVYLHTNIRDFKIMDNGRLRRLDAYTGDLGRVR